MEIGRTTRGKLNKAKNPISDYMDRFIQIIQTEIMFDRNAREYFERFRNWKDFIDTHFLIDGYIDNNLNIEIYSDIKNNQSENFIGDALKKMERRAGLIAESKYADELWKYFNELKLFEEVRYVSG